MFQLDRGTQEATELHFTYISSVKADWPSKVSFSRHRKERQSRIRGVNRPEEGYGLIRMELEEGEGDGGVKYKQRDGACLPW